MTRMTCPWCGPRDLADFAYGGEAARRRPADPRALDDAAWADYLFLSDNTRGRSREDWVHRHGCGRWFVVTRNSATDTIEGPGE
jgi:sarcosine oxidase subunit delta